MLTERNEIHVRKPDDEEDGDRYGRSYSCSPEDDGDSSTNSNSGPDDDMGSDGNNDD